MQTRRITSLLLVLGLSLIYFTAFAAPGASSAVSSAALAARAKWGVLAEPGMSLGTFTRLRIKSLVPLIQDMHARNKRAFEVDSQRLPKVALAMPYGVLTIVGVGGHAALAGYDIVQQATRSLTGR